MKIKPFHPKTAFGLLLVILLTFGLAGEVFAAPTIGPVNITNVRDGSFVVSWTTDTASDGTVYWGTTTPVSPGTGVADSVASTTTHYVQIEGLSASTTYYFYVVSGGTVDNKGGAFYQVKTGALLSPPSPTDDLVLGRVFLANGSTPAPYATVYLQMEFVSGGGSPGISQVFSARASMDGSWIIPLDSLRTADFLTYYNYSAGAHNLRIFGQGGAQGASTPILVSIPPSAYPILRNIVLNQGPTAANLNYFRSWKTDAGVQLSWETLSEASTAGFNLYRRELAGDFVQINDTLIPPQNAGQPEGSAYSFLDTTADPGLRYEYRLDIIEPGLSVIEDALLTYWPFSVSLPLVLR